MGLLVQGGDGLAAPICVGVGGMASEGPKMTKKRRAFYRPASMTRNAAGPTIGTPCRGAQQCTQVRVGRHDDVGIAGDGGFEDLVIAVNTCLEGQRSVIRARTNTLMSTTARIRRPGALALRQSDKYHVKAMPLDCRFIGTRR